MVIVGMRNNQASYMLDVFIKKVLKKISSTRPRIDNYHPVGALHHSRVSMSDI